MDEVSHPGMKDTKQSRPDTEVSPQVHRALDRKPAQHPPWSDHKGEANKYQCGVCRCEAQPGDYIGIGARHVEENCCADADTPDWQMMRYKTACKTLADHGA